MLKSMTKYYDNIKNAFNTLAAVGCPNSSDLMKNASSLTHKDSQSKSLYPLISSLISPLKSQSIFSSTYRTIKRAAVITLLTSILTPLAAKVVEDIEIPDSIEVQGQTLVLNGAGVRSKFFIDVYVAGLYLQQKTNKDLTAIEMLGNKRVLMHIIRDEIDQEDIQDAWRDGLEDNSDIETLSALKTPLAEFIALWPTLKGGDVVFVDFVQDQGLELYINEEQIGGVNNTTMFSTILKIWLGQTPADSSLKDEFLGE